MTCAGSSLLGACSPIALGTAVFGSEIDQKTSFAVLDTYVENGGNFLDTAHIYAAWIESGWGASERTVGEWLQANGMRDKMVLATKGGHPPMDNMSFGRCSADALEQDMAESLERLGVDHVDLYWLHRDDPERPIADIMQTLASFVQRGLIRAYGLSNWTPGRMDAAMACVRENGFPPVLASQIGWALADHPTNYHEPSPMVYMDETFFQWHVSTQLPLAAYSSQATGYFGEANVQWALAGFQGPPPRGKGFDSAASRNRLLATITVAHEKACTPVQVALAYLRQQPFPVLPIVGSSRPERIIEALNSLAIHLAQEDLARLTIP